MIPSIKFFSDAPQVCAPFSFLFRSLLCQSVQICVPCKCHAAPVPPLEKGVSFIIFRVLSPMPWQTPQKKPQNPSHRLVRPLVEKRITIFSSHNASVAGRLFLFFLSHIVVFWLALFCSTLARRTRPASSKHIVILRPALFPKAPTPSFPFDPISQPHSDPLRLLSFSVPYFNFVGENPSSTFSSEISMTLAFFPLFHIGCFAVVY